jgi:glycosyltransferase involved in cell wall biosynthesis
MVAARGCPAVILDSFLSKGEVNALISLADCYTSLHRSEGFGLPLAEAMYLKKPVIATAYSGNLDFMNVNNSFLVKYRLSEIKEDIGPYKAGSVWAEPDIEHAAALMRQVYEDRGLGLSIGRRASLDVQSEFSPQEVGKRIAGRMKIITGTSRSGVGGNRT